MKTLLYARFSSQLQNPRSIADQFASLRARAAAEGWEILGEYHDAAISGAAGIEDSQRPGLAAMLARLERGGPESAIDQVFTESTDRIARHQGDAFAVRERIEHAGARLFTLMDGHVDDITGTIKSLFDSRTRKDLAERVRRGHRGNIAQGRVASGVAYGYRKLIRHDEKGEPIRGLREIDPVTSEIVERVFAEYSEGRSTKQIAADLNAEGIPAPRGGLWRPSTLHSRRKQGFGILANPIYVGRLLYGRTQTVVDPRTRQRGFRASDKPPAEGEAPHLRIVSDALWQAVQDQLEDRGRSAPHRQRRPRHLLSGLGVCGLCGENWVVVRRPHFGCSGANVGSGCANRRMIAQSEYEERVLAELTGQMLAPEVVAAYLEEYAAEHTRRTRELTRTRDTLERRKAEAGRKAARLVVALAEGGSEFPEIRAALAAAKAEQAAAEKELAAADALPTIALHPGLARQYRAAIENLAAELADETTRRHAAPKLRALIARIVVTPKSEKRRGGVNIEVVRHIDEVLNLATRKSA